MHEIALFVEDHAHRVIVGALVDRVAQEIGVAVHLQWRSATGGHGRSSSNLNAICTTCGPRAAHGRI